MAILRRPGATNQGFQSLVLKDGNNPYFVFTMGSMIKESAEKVASGSTFAEISGKMLGTLEFIFPNKVEQKKIGEYFQSIDNLITLHQRMLFMTYWRDSYEDNKRRRLVFSILPTMGKSLQRRGSKGSYNGKI